MHACLGKLRTGEPPSRPISCPHLEWACLSPHFFRLTREVWSASSSSYFSFCSSCCWFCYSYQPPPNPKPLAATVYVKPCCQEEDVSPLALYTSSWYIGLPCQFCRLKLFVSLCHHHLAASSLVCMYGLLVFSLI